MKDYIAQFIPIISTRSAKRHNDILLSGDRLPLIGAIEDELGVEVHVTHYIDPDILRIADTKKGKWKLRQPVFQGLRNITTENIIQTLDKFDHPYYKRVTIIDKNRKLVTKIYSIEQRKNYAIGLQGAKWGNMIRELNLYTDILPNLLYWFPFFNGLANIHVAIYELIEGESLHDKYAVSGKRYDDRHPDTLAGRLDPYWGNISGVNYKNILKVKKIICNLFSELYHSSQNISLDKLTYQQLENEPEWKDMWDNTDPRRMINTDDWSLRNIRETSQGKYKIIKLDRTVVTDPTNGARRLSADLRNQTNITINPIDVIPV